MVNSLIGQLSITKSRRDKLLFAINICLKHSSFPRKKLAAILEMIALIKPYVVHSIDYFVFIYLVA